MASGESGKGLQILTAVMLGLVSLVTALGAWQASVWDSRSNELARDSSDARDVSVNQAIQADYQSRLDQEAIASASVYHRERLETEDLLEQLFYDLRIQTELGAGTAGLDTAWRAWIEDDMAESSNPILDPDYQVELTKIPDSYRYVSLLAGDFASSLEARSAVFAQAALIHALALFLLGIAGVNRLRNVRGAVVGIGIAVFLAGIVLAATAY